MMVMKTFEILGELPNTETQSEQLLLENGASALAPRGVPQTCDL